MAKTEVYSWRLDPELKQQLEAAARAEKTSVSAVLERLAKQWLKQSEPADTDAEQGRLRALAMSSSGIVDDDGDDGQSATNARVREVMGKRLEAKYGKPRSD